MIKNLSPSLKKRLLVLPIIGVASAVISVTIAYSQDRSVMNNVFELAGYHTIYTETFDAPMNWSTCETIPKTIAITNDIASTGDIAVRIKLEEQWIASDGVTELPLKSPTSNKTMAIINFADNSGWEKQGSYYYYGNDLAKGVSSSSLMTGVTLNCDANIDTTDTAASDADSLYSGATYRLKITAQSIKADLKDSWDGELAEIIAKQENHLGNYEIKFNTGAKKSNSTSEANGNGVNKYTEKGKDIYYFRGEIDNNNVIWANKCWKMMRTTYTGGVKMIYNGDPSEVVVDGRTTQQCNAVDEDAVISYGGESEFSYNLDDNSPTYIGYMYGEAYPIEGRCMYRGCIYGRGINYDSNTGMYTLTSTYTIPDNEWSNNYSRISSTYEYSCLSTSQTTCSTVYYVLYASSTTEYGINISGVPDVDTAVDRMFANNNDSSAKIAVEGWFEQSGVSSHESDLEDAIYCNDRRLYGGSLTSVYGLEYAASRRLYPQSSSYVGTFHPDLDCEKRDAFTKDDNINGNASLSHKIGLPTADEFTLAGVNTNTNTGYSGNYLRNSESVMSMTPRSYGLQDLASWVAVMSDYAIPTGNSRDYSVKKKRKIRPVVSLKARMEVAGGSGLKTDPYIIE